MDAVIAMEFSACLKVNKPVVQVTVVVGAIHSGRLVKIRTIVNIFLSIWAMPLPPWCHQCASYGEQCASVPRPRQPLSHHSNGSCLHSTSFERPALPLKQLWVVSQWRVVLQQLQKKTELSVFRRTPSVLIIFWSIKDSREVAAMRKGGLKQWLTL